MSLDISKLENVYTRGGKTIARCPACAEAGHDQKGEHLVLNGDDSFGCVVHPGDSVDAKAHRKEIFALCGDREIKPLTVRPSGLGRLGRLGRVNQSQSAGQPLKTGLLGRLGRVFQTHLEGDRQSTGNKKHPPEYQQNDCEKGVLAVLSEPTSTGNRPLSERERVRASRSRSPSIRVNDKYILQDRDGDYVEKVESGTSETVKMHFTFTKDIAKAKHFSYSDLWSPLATTSIGGEFTRGFGGGRAINV
jgi:hypothetical protein